MLLIKEISRLSKLIMLLQSEFERFGGETGSELQQRFRIFVLKTVEVDLCT